MPRDMEPLLAALREVALQEFSNTTILGVNDIGRTNPREGYRDTYRYIISFSKYELKNNAPELLAFKTYYYMMKALRAFPIYLPKRRGQVWLSHESSPSARPREFSIQLEVTSRICKPDKRVDIILRFDIMELVILPSYLQMEWIAEYITSNPYFGIDLANGDSQSTYYSSPQESLKDAPEEEVTDLGKFADMLKGGLDEANEISPRRINSEGSFSDN